MEVRLWRTPPGQLLCIGSPEPLPASETVQVSSTNVFFLYAAYCLREVSARKHFFFPQENTRKTIRQNAKVKQRCRDHDSFFDRSVCCLKTIEKRSVWWFSLRGVLVTFWGGPPPMALFNGFCNSLPAPETSQLSLKRVFFWKLLCLLQKPPKVSERRLPFVLFCITFWEGSPRERARLSF